MQHYELEIRLEESVWAQILLHHLPLPEWVHTGCCLPWLVEVASCRCNQDQELDNVLHFASECVGLCHLEHDPVLP